MNKENRLERNVRQSGDKSLYVESAEIVNLIVEKSKLSIPDLLENLKLASVDLSSYNNNFGNKIHISRNETSKLYDWILAELKGNASPVAILAGNAGYGKSVILKDLYNKLKSDGIFVLGIKADRLKVNSIQELTIELRLSDHIESIFKTLNEKTDRIVLLVDQIDALSQSLSSNRSPINTYHRLISRLSLIPNIRIIISSRLYDLDYDPILQEYKNKKVFKTDLLQLEDVEKVLTKLNIKVPDSAIKLKEFLRVPLHLQLFCKIDRPQEFSENITLQDLYDCIWDDYILIKPDQNNLIPSSVENLIQDLANKMYDSQQIFVNKKIYTSKYKKELEYLSHQEIITNIDKNKIQFMHQSFFDYAYSRTFVESRSTLSVKLKEQHQGLFVRSKVKQVLSYLRDYDTDLYIQELEAILLEEEYRFHIKLLLINELGFFPNPIDEEKLFVRNKLSINHDLFRLFIESIYSIEWFEFLTKNNNLRHYFEKDDEEFVNAIYTLCHRIINSNPNCVVSFLKNLPDTYKNKNLFIGRVLISLVPEKIECSFDLFKKTKLGWNNYERFHYLRIAIQNNPDFVVGQLRDQLFNELPKKKATEYEYIPDSHESSSVYNELYKKHPDIAIPFFITAIDEIAKCSKWDTEENEDEHIFQNWAYYMYTPFKDSQYHLHQKIYDFVLKYIEDKFETKPIVAKDIILPLLQSNSSSILNIAVISFVKHPQQFLNEIFGLLSKESFFIDYLKGDKLFRYNIIELLGASYSLFSPDKQKFINDKIVVAIPDYDKKNVYCEKGVTKFGYTRILSNPYKLISAIPYIERIKYPVIDNLFKEQQRKYGNIKNEAPKGVVFSGVSAPLPQKAYDKMTFDQWKSSFVKYNPDNYTRLNGADKLEHCRAFRDYVSKDPARFVCLIEDIILDKSISISYSVYGLKGLKDGCFDSLRMKQLFINLVTNRTNDLKHEDLLYLVWLVKYFIDESVVDRVIIDFLVSLVRDYEDGEMLNDDPVTNGINRVRGAAASKLVLCYKFKEFEEDIFSALDTIADEAAVHTRAAILYQLSLLNNLDGERNLDLFLKLMYDFNPMLLKLPLHNLHPLVYLINVNFLKLKKFFIKAIDIEESHEPISHILFIAWLRDYKDSEELLNLVLSKSTKAKKTVVREAFKAVDEVKYAEKCWHLIKKFIEEDNAELGKTYEHAFLDLKNDSSPELIAFLDIYVKSPIGKYRDTYFYKFLLSSASDIPEKCIKWSLSFKDHSKTDTQNRFLCNEPLQVVIQAYNGIRKFDKRNIILEDAMDAFDEMLKVPEYRGTARDVLQSLDD